MPTLTHKITPFLWFDTQAEEAAKFYTSIFDNSRIRQDQPLRQSRAETHGREAGSVMTVEFEIEGQPFVALNGGPHFKFSEAVSFQVTCETQDEIDYFWSKLSEGGEEGRAAGSRTDTASPGRSCRPMLPQLLMDSDKAKSERAMSALMQMKKFDIAALQRAHAGAE